MTTTPSPSAMLEAVCAKILEANPELLEIKEGCRVLWNGDVMTICGIQTCGIHKGMVQLVFRGQTVGAHVQKDEDDPEEKWSDAAFFDKPWEKVIGQPIHLEHVLRAIDNKHFERYSIGADGTWFDGGKVILLAGWKLWLPFEEQSEHAIRFLHFLLCE